MSSVRRGKLISKLLARFVNALRSKTIIMSCFIHHSHWPNVRIVPGVTRIWFLYMKVIIIDIVNTRSLRARTYLNSVPSLSYWIYLDVHVIILLASIERGFYFRAFSKRSQRRRHWSSCFQSPRQQPRRRGRCGGGLDFIIMQHWSMWSTIPLRFCYLLLQREHQWFTTPPHVIT